MGNCCNRLSLMAILLAFTACDSSPDNTEGDPEQKSEKRLALDEHLPPTLTGENSQVVSGTFSIPKELFAIADQRPVPRTSCGCTTTRWLPGVVADDALLSVSAELRGRSGDQSFLAKLESPSISGAITCRLLVPTQAIIKPNLGEAVWQRNSLGDSGVSSFEFSVFGYPDCPPPEVEFISSKAVVCKAEGVTELQNVRTGFREWKMRVAVSTTDARELESRSLITVKATNGETIGRGTFLVRANKLADTTYFSPRRHIFSTSDKGSWKQQVSVTTSSKSQLRIRKVQLDDDFKDAAIRVWFTQDSQPPSFYIELDQGSSLRIPEQPSLMKVVVTLMQVDPDGKETYDTVPYNVILRK